MNSFAFAVAGHSAHSGAGAGRLIVAEVLLVFLGIVWLAGSGHFDPEIGHAAQWLEHGWDRGAARVHGLFG